MHTVCEDFASLLMKKEKKEGRKNNLSKSFCSLFNNNRYLISNL